MLEKLPYYFLEDTIMPYEFSVSFPESKESVSIKLKRTTRIENNGETHELPPDLGQFEYFQLDGKNVLPIGDKEAVWFDFTGNEHNLFPVAVQIFTDEVNVITGKKLPSKPKLSIKQDFVTLPAQPWLDGYETGDGVVRQFVAVEDLKKSVVDKLNLETTKKERAIEIIVFPPSKKLVEDIRIQQEIDAIDAEIEGIDNQIDLLKNGKRYFRSVKNLCGPNLSGDLSQMDGDAQHAENLGDPTTVDGAIQYAEDLIGDMSPIDGDEDVENLSLTKMGMGAGGLITQEIVESKYNPLFDFDQSNPQRIN
jgi:hypothetical protein